MKPPSRKRESTSLSQSSSKTPTTTKNRRYTNITSMMTSPVATSNAYESLDSDENLSEGESMFSAVSKDSKRRKLTKKAAKSNNVPKSTHKPPPLNIVGVEYAKISGLLDAIKTKADDYSSSLAPFGIRVYSANTDRYNALKSELLKAEIKFFTYQLREEQLTKIVLKNLFSMNVDELKIHLNEAGIHPVKITVMNIHQKKFSDHCLYLLYFVKSDKVNVSQLKEITSTICHVKILWKNYKNKRNGPMQCSRCMKYGHGANNCYLDPVCIRCGDRHLSNACPLLFDPTTKVQRTRIPDEMLRCGLCNQNHSANFSGCVKRVEFIERQQRYRNRNQRQARQQQINHGFVNAPQLENFNFPPLDPRARAESLPQTQIPQRPSLNNELFTPTELMSIFKELMAAISQARTKTEQISALGEIAIKYCNV